MCQDKEAIPLDTEAQILCIIRRGICVVTDEEDEISKHEPEVTVKTTETLWKQIVAKVGMTSLAEYLRVYFVVISEKHFLTI